MSDLPFPWQQRPVDLEHGQFLSVGGRSGYVLLRADDYSETCARLVELRERLESKDHEISTYSSLQDEYDLLKLAYDQLREIVKRSRDDVESLGIFS